MTTHYSSVHILGVRVDRMRVQEILEQIQQVIDDRSPKYGVTVNPEFVVRAQNDRYFLGILNNAYLALPDGVGLLFAARLFRKPIPERIPGTDLAWKLFNLAEVKGYRVYLLGGAERVATEAAKRLRMLYPRLHIVGAESGGQIDETMTINNPQLLERIRTARPDILLVAYGAPKQEFWMAKFQKTVEVPFAIGVGGTLDYIAGIARRAPVLMRALGLEWLYRLYHQPWRWRRIWTATFVFGWLVLKRRFFQKST